MTLDIAIISTTFTAKAREVALIKLIKMFPRLGIAATKEWGKIILLIG